MNRFFSWIVVRGRIAVPLLGAALLHGVAQAEPLTSPAAAEGPPAAAATAAPEGAASEPAAPASAPLGPKYLPYDASAPIPEGYQLVKRRRIGLFAAGGSVLTISYGFTALTGLTLVVSRNVQYGLPQFIPLVGPLISLTQTHRLEEEARPIMTVWSIMNASAQGVGLGIMIAGLLSKKSMLMRRAALSEKVQILPALGPNQTGLMLLGRF